MIETAHTRVHTNCILINENKRITKIVLPEVKKKYVHDGFNFIQRSMYNRLVLGFSAYTKEQIASMDTDSLELISKSYSVANKIIIRLMKQKFIRPIDNLLKAIFPDYDFSEDFELPEGCTLQKLGITTKDVCEEFIKQGLLPVNFFDLTIEKIKL